MTFRSKDEVLVFLYHTCSMSSTISEQRELRLNFNLLLEEEEGFVLDFFNSAPSSAAEEIQIFSSA